MWIWNFNQNNERSIKNCTIEYATEGGSWQVLENWTNSLTGQPYFAQAPGADGYSHNTEVDMRGIPARAVKITVVDNYGYPDNAGLAEVRFYTGHTVAFESAASSGPESVPAVNVPVILSGPQDGTVTVDYHASGGTATEADDYALAGQTLTFAASQTVRNIGISIVDDGLDEDDETIEITLSNPAGGVTLGASEHVYTILDPRPKVAFDASASSAAEDGGAAGVDVSLSLPSPVTVTVEYSVSGGTAAPAADFTGGNGTLTFTAGQTLRSLPVTVVDDDDREGPETLTLSNPGNARLGAVTSHVLTILDDELGSEFTNTIGMEFTLIPAGTFTMGSDGGGEDERPEHDVTISRPFYLSNDMVTPGQYAQFYPGGGHVTWEDANDFCAWLSQQEARPYRLPTEAEWEYAWSFLNINSGMPQWCYDWYGPYEAGHQTDPVGRANGPVRVQRGSSRHGRLGWLPQESGFRVVMGEMPGTEPLAPVLQRYQQDVSQQIPADVQFGPGSRPDVPFFDGPRVFVKIPPELDGGPLCTASSTTTRASRPVPTVT
jgi:hypothetical protein